LGSIDIDPEDMDFVGEADPAGAPPLDEIIW